MENVWEGKRTAVEGQEETRVRKLQKPEKKGIKVWEIGAKVA